MTKSQQIQKAAEDLMLYDLTYSEEYKKALAVPYQPRHTEPMFPVAPKIVLGIFIILNAVYYRIGDSCGQEKSGTVTGR